MAKRKTSKAPARKAATKKTAKKAVKKTARKTAKKKAGGRRAAASSSIKLSEIRKQLEKGAGALSAILSSGRAAQPKLAEKQALISRIASELADVCDEDMQQICGPDMAIPV